jgi:hypothetical protein
VLRPLLRAELGEAVGLLLGSWHRQLARPSYLEIQIVQNLHDLDLLRSGPRLEYVTGVELLRNQLDLTYMYRPVGSRTGVRLFRSSTYGDFSLNLKIFEKYFWFILKLF